MKTSRMSMQKQWANIGKGAFKRGLTVDAVLTGKESIDRLIQSGYNAAKKKAARCQKKIQFRIVMSAYMVGTITETEFVKQIGMEME